jgi:leader peptidase (prepilin peptidase)/N-methyltransferase
MIEALSTHPAFFIACATLFGLVVGSFLNVVIHRLPRMMEREWRAQCAELNGQPLPDAPPYNLMAPRSACPTCGHRITALENVPVLSYLFLRGKCAACHAPISPRYPLVEALSGLLAGAIAWKFGVNLHALAAYFLVACLIALTFIDFDTHLLPDDITLPLLWAGLLFNLHDGFVSLHSAVIGAMAGYVALWSIYWLFRLATGKEGMGYGDFKLLAALGAWFGWQLLPAVILLSSLTGSIVGIALMVLARHGRNVPMPFGPYLALGGIAALFWGPQLAGLYLG